MGKIAVAALLAVVLACPAVAADPGRNPISAELERMGLVPKNLPPEKPAASAFKRHPDPEQLCEACAKQDIPLVQRLVKERSDLNFTCAPGVSPLGFAAVRNNAQMIGLLLSAGADPNYFPEPGMVSPLMKAIGSGGLFELERLSVDLLLDAGADVNLGDPSGYTALMSAASRGNLPMVLHLLKRGADINARTKHQKNTALTYARKNAHLEVARALLDLGAE